MKKFIMVLMLFVSLGSVAITDVHAGASFSETVDEIKNGDYRNDANQGITFDTTIDEHLLLENDIVNADVEMVDQVGGTNEIYFLFVGQNGNIDGTTAIAWQDNSIINVGDYLIEYDGLYIETTTNNGTGFWIYNLYIDKTFKHVNDEDIKIEYYSIGQDVANSVVYWHEINITDSQPIANDVAVVGENNSFISNNILENDVLSADETAVDSFKVVNGEQELSYSTSEMINDVELEGVGVIRFHETDMTVELVGEDIDEDKVVEVEYTLVDSDGSNSSASMVFNLESTVVKPVPKGPTLPNTGNSSYFIIVIGFFASIVYLKKRFTN